MMPEKKLGVRFIFFWIKNKYEYVSNLNANLDGWLHRFFSFLIGVQLKVLKCLN